MNSGVWNVAVGLVELPEADHTDQHDTQAKEIKLL